MRRREILRCAEVLFSQDGVDATTVAAIAEKAGISPPTVFNYFGSKENVLQALIFEGTKRKRASHISQPRVTGAPFAEVMHGFLCDMTENTLQIASKRVWRYAEAVNIRRPESDFGQKFSHSDRELVKLVETFLNDYAVVLRNGEDGDLGLVAQLFFGRWTARYFDFIKTETMTLPEHFAALKGDVDAMVALIFDDEFAARSPLRKPVAA